MRQIQFVLQYEHIYNLFNIYTDCKQVEPHFYMQLKNTEWVLMLSKRCGENARKANKMDKQQKETVQAVGKVVVLVSREVWTGLCTLDSCEQFVQTSWWKLL